MDKKQSSHNFAQNKKSDVHVSKCGAHNFPLHIPEPELETRISPLPAITPAPARSLPRTSNRNSSSKNKRKNVDFTQLPVLILESSHLCDIHFPH